MNSGTEHAEVTSLPCSNRKGFGRLYCRCTCRCR